jgi:hypothetical protein
MINVKIDGEALSSLTHIDYRVARNKENFTIKGNFIARSTNPKLDSLLLMNVADAKPFQLVIENKEIGQLIKTLSFDDCHVDGKNVSMDPFGVGLFGYSFTASRVREQ